MGLFGRRARRTDRGKETRLSAVADWVAVDVETAAPSRDSLCAVAAIKVVDAKLVASYNELVKPPSNQYSDRNTMVHGITPKHTARSRTFSSVAHDLWEFIGESPIVAHNASFDRDVFQQTHRSAGVPMPTANDWVCTMDIAKTVWPDLPTYRLKNLCLSLGIPLDHHRAESDAAACALLALALMDAADVSDIQSLASLSKRAAKSGSTEKRSGEATYTKKHRIAPDDWTDEEVASAQRVVDLWLAGKKLSEIDAEVGEALGSASTVLNRLRKNGMEVPLRSRGRGAEWTGAVPEALEVKKEHLGKRRALKKDTPPGARVVVFTGETPHGMDRSELERFAKEAGWIVRSNVSKKTTLLVRCDPSFFGGKVAKAQELGTRSVSPEEFVAVVRNKTDPNRT